MRQLFIHLVTYSSTKHSAKWWRIRVGWEHFLSLERFLVWDWKKGAEQKCPHSNLNNVKYTSSFERRCLKSGKPSKEGYYIIKFSCEKIYRLPNQKDDQHTSKGEEVKERRCVLREAHQDVALEIWVERWVMSSTMYMTILFWAKPRMMTQNRPSALLSNRMAVTLENHILPKISRASSDITY